MNRRNRRTEEQRNREISNRGISNIQCSSKYLLGHWIFFCWILDILLDFHQLTLPSFKQYYAGNADTGFGYYDGDENAGGAEVECFGKK